MSEALETGAAPSLWRELRVLLRTPRHFFAERFAHAAPPQWLLVFRVAPWAAIRPVAVLLRSLLAGTPLAGVVLGLGSLALQVGTWLGASLVLPALARQFHAEITDRQAYTLATYGSIPLWLAGVLFVVPEEPDLLFIWSRLLAAVVALWCVHLTREGVIALGIDKGVQVPLVAAIAGAGALLHGTLYLLLGVGANIVLYVFG